MADAPISVQRSIEVEAEPDAVWELHRRRRRASRWFGGPTTLDPRPGGTGRFVEPGGTHRSARVDEAVPGRRLTWTWTAGDPDDHFGDDDGDTTRVEIDLSPCPTGTRVTVTETPVVPGATMSALASARGPLLDLELRILLRAGSAQLCRC